MWVVSFFSVSATLTGLSDGTKIRFSDPVKTDKPYFDDVGPRNVTAVVGQTALLKCRVKHPGERTVSNPLNAKELTKRICIKFFISVIAKHLHRRQFLKTLNGPFPAIDLCCTFQVVWPEVNFP